MNGRRAWGGVGRVVVVVVVAVVSEAWNPQRVLAGDHPSDQRWHSSDGLLQNGQPAVPEPILEVHFQYDADATPSLSVKQLFIKHGHAPQYELLDSGYVLSLHAESADVLSTVTFRIPNVVFNPPPQPGDAPGEGPLVLRTMEFALTVPMVQGAVELHVTDPQGVLIIQESLRDVPVTDNQPHFRSLRQRHSLPASPPAEEGRRPYSRYAWLLDLFVETAEAAATGTALDVTFVGDNYTVADLNLFHQDVERVAAHMMTYEPYVSRASQILFHSVDNATTDLGCVHSPTMSRLITCNNATVTSVVNDAGAPYDKIIVLVKDTTYGGSGGAISVSYNGSSAPQVAVHEFGHSFGGLWDEYTLYSTNGTLDGRTYVNCYAGSPPNSRWDGLVASSDYASGCTYPNWYRSSSCSIMLTLSCQYFNPVSQRQLNAKLDTYAGTISPTLTLSANPTLIGLGGSSALSWSSTNVTTCSAAGAWSGEKPTSGAETVTPTAASTYTLACVGVSSSVTQSVTVSVDVQAPHVTLTSPVSGATVSGVVALGASATDDQGVNRLDFYKDGTLLGSDNTSPYGINWNTANDPAGSHTLTASALDTAGNTGTSSPVIVTVAADTQAPQVTLLTPADGTQVAGKVIVEASGTDDVAVTRLELYIDGSLQASSTASSVKTTWNTRARSVKLGAHTIMVTGVDAAGNLGSMSITVFK
jgi:hypothetical protein